MSKHSLVPTKEQRFRVSVCAGGGWAHEEIAICLGISRSTLEKHFAFELSTGAYQRRAEVLESMYRMAEHGNVAAQKAYSAMTPHVSAPPLPQDQPAVREGKKAKAQADAVTAHQGTEWAELLTAPVQ